MTGYLHDATHIYGRCLGIRETLSYSFNFGNRPGTLKRAMYILRHDTRYPVEIGSRKRPERSLKR
jgi:hypothetical protein